MFRWILDDTRALIADIRSLAQRLSTRWHWFGRRSARRWDQASADFENVRRSVESRRRMCSSCRALIPADARVCPECGETPGRPVSSGLTRVLENMLPGVVSVSSVILTLNLIGYGLSLFIYSELAGGGLPPPQRGYAWDISLIALGANVPELVAQGEAWRLLTSVFLHGGLLHVFMNCWALLAVGPLVEEMYGARRFILIYVVTGVGGSLASFLWHFGQPSVGIGASGAIFGLIGVASVWGWRRGGRLGEGIRGQMVQWAIYGLAMGFLFRFDNAAHLGGLVAGALLGLAIPGGEPREKATTLAWEVAAWGCGLLVVGSFAMAVVRYEPTLRMLVNPL